MPLDCLGYAVIIVVALRAIWQLSNALVRLAAIREERSKQDRQP